MTRKPMRLATVSLAVSAFSASAAHSDIPADYTALVPSDAYAVAWIDDVQGILDNAAPLMPPGTPVPANLSEMLAEAMAINGNASVGNNVLAWVTRGQDMGNNQFGDPQVFFAVKAQGANAQNVQGGPDAAVFFSGNMIIVGQGAGADWTKPEGPRSALFRNLSNDSIAAAIDIKTIWEDRSSQLQMLGGFGAMAAQMALMEQTQDAAPENQERMRQAQKKIGDVIRRSLKGIFEELAVMETLSLGVNLDNDSDFAISADFAYQDLLTKRGVNPALLDKMSSIGGQTIYFAADAGLIQWTNALQLNLLDTLLVLDQKQQAGLEAFMPMMSDLLDSITGGCVIAINPSPTGFTEYVDLEVKNADEFINGTDTLMSHVHDLDIGIRATKHTPGEWEIWANPSELTKGVDGEMTEAIAGMGDIAIQTRMRPMRGDDSMVSLFMTSGAGPHGANDDTTLLDTMRVKPGQSLVMAMAMDLQAMFGIAMDTAMMMGVGQDGASGNEDSPIPFTLRASTKGKNFKFEVNFNALDVSQLGMMAAPAF